MSCWSRRTPLETLFIMKLCFSLPFFIIVLIITLVYLVTKNNDYDCVEWCANGTLADNKTRLSIEGFELDDPEDICDYEGKSGCYFPKTVVISPIMASLSQSVYADDPAPARFKCPAVIVTPQFALTSSRCVPKQLNKQFYLRSASDYWSQGGIVHSIEKIFFAENNSLSLAALKVSPAFPMTDLINFARIEENAPLTMLHTFTWKMNIKADVLIGKKYAPIEKVNLTMDNCKKFRNDFICKFKYKDLCLVSPGSPILNEKNTILGFLLDVVCDDKQNVFYYGEIGKYRVWLEDTLKFNNSAYLSAPCKSKREI